MEDDTISRRAVVAAFMAMGSLQGGDPSEWGWKNYEDALTAARSAVSAAGVSDLESQMRICASALYARYFGLRADEIHPFSQASELLMNFADWVSAIDDEIDGEAGGTKSCTVHNPDDSGGSIPVIS